MEKILRQEDFYFQNDYIDDVVNNLDNHEYDEILYSSLAYFNPEYLFDYMLLNCGIDNRIEYLKRGLKDLGCYEDYLNSVLNFGDEYLKSHVVLYLENDLLYSFFNNETEIAKAIINVDYAPKRIKIYDLMKLTEFKCSEFTIDMVKDAISNCIDNYDEKIDENYVDVLKETYFKIIDENQSAFNSKKLKKNK